MAETTQFMFDLQEVLEELIRRQGLNKGRWKIVCELGFAGTNVQGPSSDGEPTMRPAAMVVIQRIGLTKTDETNNLTLDAAVVNPATASKPSVGALAAGKGKRRR